MPWSRSKEGEVVDGLNISIPNTSLATGVLPPSTVGEVTGEATPKGLAPKRSIPRIEQIICSQFSHSVN